LIPGRGKLFSSSPQLPDWLWIPFNILSNVNWRHFSLGKGGRGVKLTTHLHLVPELYLYLYISAWQGAWLIKHRENFTFTFLLTIANLVAVRIVSVIGRVTNAM
jgi:hypothetical protein